MVTLEGLAVRRLACCLWLVLAMPSMAFTTAAAQQRTFQPPTATEVFNLRSRCAALGDKIMENNFVSSTLSQSNLSHYDPQTNRCYVELTVIDMSNFGNYFNSVLFDGQTKEILASASIRKGKKSGSVNDHQHEQTTPANAGFDDATAYIDKMMAEDRQ